MRKSGQNRKTSTGQIFSEIKDTRGISTSTKIKLRLIFSFLLIVLFFCMKGMIRSEGHVQYSKGISVATKIYNILWYTRINPNFWYLRNETIHCPINENKSVLCNVYLKWENHPCNIDAYLFFASVMHTLPLYRNPHQLWAVVHEESPRLNPIFLSEKLLELFNFSATFSRHSDVPFPLQYFGPFSQKVPEMDIATSIFNDITGTKYFLNTTTKNLHLKEISPLLYIQSNKDTFIDRDKFVLKLMDYISIDSYGNNSASNRKLPANFHHIEIWGEEYLKFTSRYKFQISIENVACKDYMTEKLWKPIIQGVVPIYFGSPTVRDWLPNPKSAILIEDYETPELLVQYLHELLKNDSKYEEHLEHKTKKLIRNRKLMKEMEARPYQLFYSSNLDRLKCLVCSRLHEGNSGRINMVSRKALDCEMPVSLLTNAPDSNNKYTTDVKELAKEIDVIYDKYSKRIPLESGNAKFSLVPSVMKFVPGSPYGGPQFWAPDCGV